MAHPLDNPVWQSLSTAQRGLAIGHGEALRFHPDVAPFVALERNTPSARAAALALVVPGEEVCFIDVAPGDLAGWTLLTHGSIVQMTWNGRTRTDDDAQDVVDLQAADAPDMVALTTRVFLATSGSARSNSAATSGCVTTGRWSPWPASGWPRRVTAR